MELRTQSPTLRVLMLAGLALLAAAFAYRCFQLAAADTLADGGELEKLEWAVRLAPAQADYHNRLGRALIYSVTAFEMDRATEQLEAATRLSPRTGQYWMDLALAYEMQHRPPDAAAAMERAVVLRPHGVDALWTAGNYFLRTRQIDRSLPYFRQLLELTPAYNWLTFAILWRASENAEADLNRLLPASVQVWLEYLQFLVANNHPEAASRQWEKIFARKDPYDPRMVFSYFDLLLSRGQPDAARAVWQHLRDAGLIPPRPDGARGQAPSPSAPGQAAGNLLYNGDFEETPLLGGFDWRVMLSPDVTADLESPVAHTGTFSLKVQFTRKENFHFAGVAHLAPVEPLHRYRLTGFLRAEGVSSDSGPRLLVTDYYSPDKLRVMTPDVLGTTDWKEVSVEFPTLPATRLLQVVLYRPPSRTFDNKMSGRIWLDSVRLESLGPVPSGAGLGPAPGKSVPPRRRGAGRSDSLERRKVG